MGRWTPIGRVLRSRPLSARLLTEYRVRQLRRNDGEFQHCLANTRPGTLAVDIGANVGNFALGMSKRVGRDGFVLALEAHPEVFAELVSSCWGGRVAPLNLAASDTSGWAQLRVPSGEYQEQLSTLETRYVDDASTFRVRCIRLDDLIWSSQTVSMVKIDVEGHEASVLEGAGELLARDRPALVIEIEQRHHVDRSVADTVDWLHERGYRCQVIRGSRLTPWEDFDLERDQLAFLDARGDLRPGAVAAGYANNFLFTTARP